jgi:hypothetical protein
MKMKLLVIGTVPAQEQCVPPDQPDRLRRQLLEANVFMRMLSRLFSVPARGLAYFIITSTPNSASFYNVAVSYDSSNPAAVDFAVQVGRESPQFWDAQARIELCWFERSLGYYRAFADGTIKEDDIPAFYRGVTPPKCDGAWTTNVSRAANIDEMLATVVAEVARLRFAGWTRKDFVKALERELETDSSGCVDGQVQGQEISSC